MYRIPVFKLKLIRDCNITIDKQVRNPTDINEILKALLSELDTEHLIVVLLDTRHRVIGTHDAAHGGLNACHVRLADVFKAAIVGNASSIIIAHNHPSGDNSPSPDDISITKQLIDAGKLLDISVLDHIIYAENENGPQYNSLRTTQSSLNFE